MVQVLTAHLVDAVAFLAVVAVLIALSLAPIPVPPLGVHVILLTNLAWSAVLYVRFLRGRGSFLSLEKWQTGYLPVYSAWAALVVIFFPPLFNYI